MNGTANGNSTGVRSARPVTNCPSAATLIQCRKIGPFPLILMGAKFWAGMRKWGQTMIKAGVFTREEIGFGRITDSPREAVDLIVRSLPLPVIKRLNPLN
jgi:predicted Rossmann-fold nucleotide-binding protein